jgi:sugar/nucleoside kinase (ribokinase family)
MEAGGWGARFASALTRRGRKTHFRGNVGKDGIGDLLLREIKGHLDLSGIARDPQHKTSVSFSLSDGGDSSVITYPGATAALTLRGVDLRRFGHLHVCSPFLLLSQPLVPLFRKAKSARLTTSLSVGWDPRERWDLKALYPLLDVLLADEAAARALGGTVKKLADQVTLVVVRKGERGAEAATKGGAWKVSGSTAGPLFDAVFIDHWLEGDRVQDSLAAACEASKREQS